jgi:hypothetical protein
MVTQEMGGNQRWGAERTEAAPEVTAAPARIWPN